MHVAGALPLGSIPLEHTPYLISGLLEFFSAINLFLAPFDKKASTPSCSPPPETKPLLGRGRDRLRKVFRIECRLLKQLLTEQTRRL